MAPLQVNLLYDKGSAASAVRAATVERLLLGYRSDLPAFQKPRHTDLREPLIFSDVNIHVDFPLFVAFGWGHVNIALCNTDISGHAEAWAGSWDAYRTGLDAVVEGALWSAPSAELLTAVQGAFRLAIERRPTSGVVHCPPILNLEDCPAISIVTPTYNRRNLVDIALHNLMATDYPPEKIEWVIVEDHEDSEKMASDRFMSFQVNNPKITVNYIPIQGRMTIGQKRNVGVEAASNEIIVFMDDDDHYPVTSLRRRIAWLLKGKRKGCEGGNKIAFCTTIALYDLQRGVSAVNVPPWNLPLGKRISEATLTFFKSSWEERKFDEVSIAEGESWIAGREAVCMEMPPQQVIVAFSHGTNASDRRVPPATTKEVACFWGFPKEYLVFIHKLAGVELEVVGGGAGAGASGKRGGKR
jgi:hypothetical protein